MTKERFEELLDKLDGKSLDTLNEKNAKYSSSVDALHNFNKGAEFTGLTPAQTAWGYLAKHLTSLHDKIEKDDFKDKDDLLEKCQDAINYIRFIWCIANDSKTTISSSSTTYVYPNDITTTNGTTTGPHPDSKTTLT